MGHKVQTEFEAKESPAGSVKKARDKRLEKMAI